MSGRGYTWPPFEPGNTVAVKHGAWSDRKVQPVADQIAASLAEVAPWTVAQAYAGTVAAWSYAEAQALVLRAYLDEQGMLDGEGAVRPAAELFEKVERRASGYRGQLGLDPQSMVKLLSGLSSISAPAAQQGLEALAAAGAALRQQAEQRALEAGAEPTTARRDERGDQRIADATDDVEGSEAGEVDHHPHAPGVPSQPEEVPR